MNNYEQSVDQITTILKAAKGFQNTLNEMCYDITDQDAKEGMIETLDSIFEDLMSDAKHELTKLEDKAPSDGNEPWRMRRWHNARTL